MEASPGVARRGSGRPVVPEPQPALAPAPLQVTADEVVIKKRALKRMKQQVSALLWGEDLPGGDQARKLLKSPMKFQRSPGAKHHAQCASRSSRLTTGLKFIWVSTRVRNSHVVSVGRSLPQGGTGRNIPSLVFTVRGLHALCAGNCLLVLRPCTSTIKLNMELTLLCRKVGLYAHSAPNHSECKKHDQSTSHITVLILTGRALTFAGW